MSDQEKILKPHEKFLKWVFHRHMEWRLKDLVAPHFPILIRYPFQSRPRYGYGVPPHKDLSAVFSNERETYRSWIKSFAKINERYANISNMQASDERAPTWFNRFFTGLDAVALYGIISTVNPRRYVEIGSGNSTKFVRRAIKDMGLQTKITSIDPYPRREIDTICDVVIRQPLESLDLTIFDTLESGDVLFIDNSHCVFMNSDATVVFLDILPRLRPGVIVHFHDILLPFDYPPEWKDRYYSEQYPLACYLLGGQRLVPLLPCAYISQDDDLIRETDGIWRHPALKPVLDYALSTNYGFQGFSFWAKVAQIRS